MCKRLILLVSLVFVLGSAWTSPVEAADPGLVGWWKFDEGSGTIAADSSGNGMDGTLVSDPAWRQDGSPVPIDHKDGGNGPSRSTPMWPNPARKHCR